MMDSKTVSAGFGDKPSLDRGLWFGVQGAALIIMLLSMALCV